MANSEPAPRYRHVSEIVGSRVLVHGGRTRDFTEQARVHLAKVVEVFNPYLENWEQKTVSGDAPPAGTYGAASASTQTELYTFGGVAGTVNASGKESNSLHKLDSKTWFWHLLSPQNADGAPLPKFGRGMVSFSERNGRRYLAVFGGHALPVRGPPSLRKATTATFMRNVDTADGSGWTNELHIYDLSDGK